jgi:hypothetical protein
LRASRRSATCRRSCSRPRPRGTRPPVRGAPTEPRATRRRRDRGSAAATARVERARTARVAAVARAPVNAGSQTRPPRRPLFETLDANGDGVLDARELAAASAALGVDAAHLDALFKAHAGGDGVLQRDELAELLADAVVDGAAAARVRRASAAAHAGAAAGPSAALEATAGARRDDGPDARPLDVALAVAAFCERAGPPRGKRVFDPNAARARANGSDRARPPRFEHSTRAIDAPKSEPKRPSSGGSKSGRDPPNERSSPRRQTAARTRSPSTSSPSAA